VPVQVSLYERAAEERDARAMVALGTLYFLGRDVARDLEKAAHWRARAFVFGFSRSLVYAENQKTLLISSRKT